MTGIGAFAGRIVGEGNVTATSDGSLQIRPLRVADVEHLPESCVGPQINTIQSSEHIEITLHESGIADRVVEICRTRCAEWILG